MPSGTFMRYVVPRRNYYIPSRWLPQAFVIYCFFQLLVGYLGGERSLLIRVHGRQPKATPFPMNVFQRELDVSDPFTFLFLKRGILRTSVTFMRSSHSDLDFSRICASQAVPRNRFACVEGIRKIQRRRISCGLWVPLCQRHL